MAGCAVFCCFLRFGQFGHFEQLGQLRHFGQLGQFGHFGQLGQFGHFGQLGVNLTCGAKGKIMQNEMDLRVRS